MGAIPGNRVIPIAARWVVIASLFVVGLAKAFADSGPTHGVMNLGDVLAGERFARLAGAVELVLAFWIATPAWRSGLAALVLWLAVVLGTLSALWYAGISLERCACFGRVSMGPMAHFAVLAGLTAMAWLAAGGASAGAGARTK